MRIAVIDMGTNTFHLIIVEVTGEDFKILYREKTAVRIGQNGINQGMITDEAVVRAIDALLHFKTIINQYETTEVYATATSAIRNARNGEELVAEIKRQTGISTRIISGQEEAEFIYFGVKKAMPIGSEPVLIMDIGGGSIEFIIGTDTEILWKESFEIGGIRLVEKFHKHDPMLTEEVEEVKHYLEDNLQELFEACAIHQPKVLIGSSGTFDTLSDIYCLTSAIDRDPEATEYPLTLDAFETIRKQLLEMTRAERLAVPGMIPLRVDMIVVAVVLIRFIIDRLHLSDIRVSGYALKEGVLLNTLHSIKQNTNL